MELGGDLSDEISMEHDMVVYYGKRSTPRDGMSKFVVEAFASKSEGLKTSVIGSPEYVLCNKESEKAAPSPLIRTKFPWSSTTQSTYTKSYIRNFLETVFYPTSPNTTSRPPLPLKESL
ncbi:Uncharacterized protein FKW44_017837 [Caligus rogercresseyi]|uniref:Uncharacterized protein n=1 Tax=Caligus rogercresseyi TaxID=217165 RepID=A0A7T8GTY9_CALRO|nr:Uncharacterized protein FKW44_017837 [Caligus rogercresseyi]